MVKKKRNKKEKDKIKSRKQHDPCPLEFLHTFAILLDGLGVILLLEEAVSVGLVCLCILERRGDGAGRVGLVRRRRWSLIVAHIAVGDGHCKVLLGRRVRRGLGRLR